MEVLQEEATGASHDHSHVVKGRRTKRQRLLQPAVISASSVGADDQNNISSDENNVSHNNMNNNYPPSPTTSTGSTTEEEEDMANCLILLAQGGGKDWPRAVDASGRRLTEGPATTTAGKMGLYVYECKTCNRCFPSFQALGGHRASHKKPKMMVTNGVEDESESNCLSLHLGKPMIPESGNKVRVHECSICGSEFSSGQALGGHMRRHRTAMAESSSHESKKQKSLLSLDLNLPAPPEDDRDFQKSPTGFAFAGKQPLVFTASPLVDCHY